MALDRWPTTLPQSPQTAGYAASDGLRSTIRGPIAYGPQFQRQRTSTIAPLVNMVVRLNTAQVPLLNDFYITTLGRTKPFLWNDHKTLTQTCAPVPVVSVEDATYRFLTPPTYTPVGGNEGSLGQWNAAFTLVAIEDTGLYSNPVECITRKPPLFILPDPMVAEFLIDQPQPQCDPGGVWYDTGSAFYGESSRRSDISFYDRDNNRYIVTARGGNGTVLFAWNIDSNTLAWDQSANYSPNNRAYAYGYSSGGVLTRIWFSRRGALTLHDINTGLFIDTKWGDSGSSTFDYGGETTGFWIARYAGNTYHAFEKIDVTGQIDYFETWQDDILDEYSYDPNYFVIGLKNQSFFLIPVIRDALGLWAFAQFQPSRGSPGGPAGGMMLSATDTNLPVADWGFYGTAYDGVFAYVLIEHATNGSRRILKVSTAGVVTNSYPLPEIGGALDPDPNTNIDLDPNGWMIIAPSGSTSNEVIFFNVNSGDMQVKSLIYNENQSARFFGNGCRVYVSDAYNDATGSARVLDECVLCP